MACNYRRLLLILLISFIFMFVGALLAAITPFGFVGSLISGISGLVFLIDFIIIIVCLIKGNDKHD